MLLILASSSVIRAKILHSAGCLFEVVPSHVNEWEEEDGDPVAMVLKNSRKKALSVSQSHQNELVLGVDTVIFGANQTFCKPTDFDDALRMFRSYVSGEVSVFSGLTLVHKGQVVSAHDESKIFLREYSEKEYRLILPKIFSTDKSGGFGIEGLGAILLDRISGSFYNILGLPMHVLYQLINELSLNFWDFFKDSPESCF